MSILDSVKHKIEKALWSLSHKIEAGLKKVGHKIEGDIKQTGHTIEGELKDVANEAKHELIEIGEDIKKSLHQGVQELIDLAESGILEPALKKIVDGIENEIANGDAPIVFKTTYFDIEVIDVKHFATVITDAIHNGLPHSTSEWRHIIVDLAPVALHIKIGIPVIAMIAQRLPLEDLEREAIDQLLQKAGL